MMVLIAPSHIKNLFMCLSWVVHRTMMDNVQQSVPLFRAFEMVWCLFLLQNNNVVVAPTFQVKLDPYPGSKVSVQVESPIARNNLRFVVTAEAFDNNTLLIVASDRMRDSRVDVLEIRKMRSGNLLFQTRGESALVRPEDLYNVSTMAGAAESSVESYDTMIKLFASLTEELTE